MLQEWNSKYSQLQSELQSKVTQLDSHAAETSKLHDDINSVCFTCFCALCLLLWLRLVLKMLFHSILLCVQLSQAKSAAESKLSEVESSVHHRDEQISQLQATVDDLHKVPIFNVHTIQQWRCV